MVCSFFGHKDTPDNAKFALREIILKLLSEECVDFWVGNNGNFDFLVQCTLQELKKQGQRLNYSIVISRPDEKALSGEQSATVFPEELENSIPRYAISKRNSYLIKNSSFIIIYVKNKFGNSYKWASSALKKGVAVINIAELT